MPSDRTGDTSSTDRGNELGHITGPPVGGIQRPRAKWPLWAGIVTLLCVAGTAGGLYVAMNGQKPVEPGPKQDQAKVEPLPKPPPVVSDLQAVLKLAPAQLEGLDPYSPTFEANDPLGKLYAKFRNGTIADEDRRQLMQWARQSKDQVKNVDIGALLEDIASRDGLNLLESTSTPAPSATTSTNSDTSAVLPAERLLSEFAGLVAIFRGGPLLVASAGWLQADGSTAPNNLTPPAGLSEKDLGLWKRQVENLKVNEDISRIYAALRLAKLSAQANANARSAEFERFAAQLSKQVDVSKLNPTAAAELRRIAIQLEVKPAVDGLRGQVDKATAAAEAATGQAMQAQTKALEAQTKAMAAEDRAKALAAIVLITPEQLTDAIQETERVLGSLDPAQLPAEVAANVRQGLTDRRNASTALQSELSDLSKMNVLTEPDAVSARGQLQRLQAQLIGLTADYAVARAAAGTPFKWNRESLGEIVTQLESWAQQLPTDTVPADRQQAILDEVKGIRSKLTGPAVLSAQEGLDVQLRIQRLLQQVSELQIAATYQLAGVRARLSREAVAEMWKGLGLTDEVVKQLEPRPSAPQPVKEAWSRLSRDVLAVRERVARLNELTPEEEAQLLSQVGLAAHSVTLLQSVAAGGTGGTGGASGGSGATPPNLVPLWDAIDRASRDVQKLGDLTRQFAPIDSRVKALEGRPSFNAAPLEARIKSLEERPVDPTLARRVQELEAGATGVGSHLAQLRTQIDDILRNAGRAITPEELTTIVNQASGKTLEQLAKYGYGPRTSSPPGEVPPELPPQDPFLAREYSATAFTEYYAGGPEQLTRAAELFALAVQYDARNPTYRYFLALTLNRLGRVEEAEAQARAGRYWERKQRALRVDRDLARVQGSLRNWLESIRHGI